MEKEHQNSMPLVEFPCMNDVTSLRLYPIMYWATFYSLLDSTGILNQTPRNRKFI